jgi:hypothetical protein
MMLLLLMMRMKCSTHWTHYYASQLMRGIESLGDHIGLASLMNAVQVLPFSAQTCLVLFQEPTDVAFWVWP